MKKLFKKGFTIVELVIVIAVIAILAAVLIPTFSGVVEKANASAALQTARSTLTNALNMSSTASLVGKDATGYHTVIAVNGYAFGYEGNELKAIDYPGVNNVALLKSGATYNPNDAKWENNFNAIAIAADNLVETKVETMEEATFAANTGLYVKDSSGEKEVGGEKYTTTSDTTKNDNTKYYKLVKSFTYKLTGEISKIIGDICDFEHDNNQEYAVTKSGDNYTVSDGKTSPKTASLYINSDFSKKVVVFTTFSK